MNVKPRPQRRNSFFDSRIELKFAFPKLQNLYRDIIDHRRKNVTGPWKKTRSIEFVHNKWKHLIASYKMALELTNKRRSVARRRK